MPRVRRGGRPKAEKKLASSLVPLDDNTPLTRDLRAYLEAIELLAYSPRTIEVRRREVLHFVRWCVARGLHASQDLTKPILVQYQRALFHQRKKNGEPLSTATQASMLNSVRQLFAWLTRENHLDANPAADLQLPRVVRQPPSAVLTAKEAELILAVPDTSDPMGLRTRAILEVLYDTGVRRSELLALGIYDVDMARRCVHVRRGKGGKSRVIPIGERALLWVRKYLDDVRPLLVVNPDETALFLTTQGEPLSKHWLSDVVRNAIKEAGVDKPGSCHLFRHTMATLMLDGGADLRFIQAMLGHASLATTEIYTRVSIEKLREVHAATHPAKLHRALDDDDG